MSVGPYQDAKERAQVLRSIQKKMVGKKVLRIDTPPGEDLICAFTMEDGECFSLHATSFGFWIESSRTPGKKFTSLNDLADAYFDYTTTGEGKDYESVDPELRIEGTTLYLTAPNGHIFELNLKALPKMEQELLEFMPGALLRFARALPCGGGFWKTFLRDCGISETPIRELDIFKSKEDFDDMASLLVRAQELYTEGCILLPAYANKVWSGGYSVCKHFEDPCVEDVFTLLYPKNGPEGHTPRDLFKI